MTSSKSVNIAGSRKHRGLSSYINFFTMLSNYASNVCNDYCITRLVVAAVVWSGDYG